VQLHCEADELTIQEAPAYTHYWSRVGSRFAKPESLDCSFLLAGYFAFADTICDLSWISIFERQLV
jgi:hypothetical protein